MRSEDKYQCVLQRNKTDCGPAVISTVLRYYGSNIKFSKIKNMAGTNRFGTSIFGIIKVLEYYNFDCSPRMLRNKNTIFKEFVKPVIVHVRNKQNCPHYFVLYEVHKNHVIVADPAEGVVKYSIEEFFKIWDGMIIFLIPNKNYKIENEERNFFKYYMDLIRRKD